MTLSQSTAKLIHFVFVKIPEKYEYVGRLLKPGEEPASYSDEEDDNQQFSNTCNKSSDASGKPKNE